MAARPFEIKIPQETLDDLRRRLTQIRGTDEIPGAGWEYGTDRTYLQELTAYWRDRFDWRAQETALNRFAHFRAEVDGFGLHFIHERGRGANPLPLLLTHGFPDSIFRFYKLLPLLTDPASYGGDPADSFDVIVPSIPGYGFSDRPTRKGMTQERIADLFTRLMTQELGYERFGAHGGDWGSGVTEGIARSHADALAGIHLTDVPFWHLFSPPPGDLSAAERDYLEAGKKWQMTQGGYAAIQSTRPQTLACGLNDSPAGLAAWIVDLFRAWSDCDGNIEKRFTKDELLTNITIYWATETIGSACRLYFESMQSPPSGENRRVETTTGVALFAKDLVPAPREFAERFFNIQRWTEMPRGGHFAALEEPELLADDIRAFFRPLRS